MNTRSDPVNALSKAATAQRKYIDHLTNAEFLAACKDTINIDPTNDDNSVVIMRGAFDNDLSQMTAVSTSRFLLQQISESIGDIPRDMLFGVVVPEEKAGERLKTFYDVFTTTQTASSLVAGAAVVSCDAGVGGCYFTVKK